MNNFKKSGSRRDFAENRDRGFGRGGSDRSNSFGERKIMHTATCAECGDSCQVPFKPRGDKPVYCSTCFGGHSDSDRDNKTNYSKPREFRAERPSQAPDNSKLISKIDELINKLDQVVKVMTVKQSAPNEVIIEKEITTKKAPVKKASAVKKAAKGKK